MKAKLLLTVFFSIGIIAVSNAQYSQRARINEGVKSGELTRYEAAKLNRGQQDMHRDMRMARADGYISHGERREIREDRRENSRQIFRYKHNDRERRFW
jgi:hypothetical protein